MMKQMLKTWGYVVIHPKQVTFNNELQKDYATRKNAVYWLAVGILLAALVNGLSSFIYETIFRSYVGARTAMTVFLLRLPPENSALLDFISSPTFGGLTSFFTFLIGAPIVIFLANAVCLWLARTLGGNGSLDKQLFATALFVPGLLIVANFFGVIRQLGVCIVSPLAWLYAIVLSILAVKSVHGLSTAKSAVAVLVPFLVFTLAVFVVFPPHL